MPLSTVFYRLYRPYTKELILLVVLGFLGALLDGIGINMLIPFLSFLMGEGAGPLDTVTRVTAGAFAFLNIPFKFQNVLVLMAVLFTGRAAALALFSYLRAQISVRFTKRESSALLQKTLAARWQYLLALPSGYTVNTVFWDTKRAAALLDAFAQTVQSLSGCFVYLVLAFLISPVITGVTVGVGALFVLVFRPFIAKTRVFAQLTASAEKLYSQHVIEHLGGLKLIKASAVETPVHATADRYLDRLGHAVSRSALVQSLSSTLVQPFAMLFILVLFMVTYTSGTFNIATFAATIFLIQKIFTYLQSGQAAFHALHELAPFAENVLAFHESLAREQESHVGTPHQTWKFTNELSFDHVTFSYPDTAPVLRDVSFIIPAGKTVAVIGPSGAGKTTVADLLLRLFEPVEGRILVDGKPIASISTVDWRESVGYVSQDIFLLNASVADNIRFYRKDMTAEEIEHAARQASIYDFVMSLPQGFETNVGERGIMLSGGQRQRIALARALARKPNLLILDEATSALDRESERQVQEAIEALYGKITVVVIAHRLSTIERANTILVLESGRIIEQGSPAELSANKDSYYSKHRAE